MSVIYIRGTRENIVSLLRLMAEEMEYLGHSSTFFSKMPGEDPWHKLKCEEADQPIDTTMQVYR